MGGHEQRRREMVANLREQGIVDERVLVDAVRAQDVSRLVNAARLRTLWSDLFLPARVRRLWESRFPGLSSAA